MSLKDHLEKNKEFLKDNFVLFIGIFILNFLGYLFHFYVGRKLGPEDYGVFGSLLSLIYIIAMPLSAIQTTITNFAANFKARGELGKISYLLKRSLEKFFIIGIITFVLFLIAIPFISKFLKIDSYTPLVILAFFLILSLFIPIIRGVLQGLQEFKLLGWSYIFEGIAKLVTGVGLIALGFGVSGAIGGFTLSYLFAILITIYFIRKYFRKDKVKFKSNNIYKYSLPVLIMLIFLTGIYTIDILLIKHFFDETNSGYYAALSLLGKIIFFGTLSISMVMFSKVSENFAKNKEDIKLLYKSLLLVAIMGFSITGFYFLFPKFTISMLFGSQYFAMSGLLGLYALFITIFSLVYIIGFYNISANRNKFIYLLAIFNILEAGLITLYHESLLQVVIILLALVIVLFISLMIYTIIKNEKGNNINSSVQ